MSATSILNTINQMQSNTNQLNFQQNQKNVGSSSIDQNAFMQLLMAQLKYQDPTNPMDNNQFLTQQAQMSQVEQLGNLTNVMQSTSTLTQASNLVGKTVDVKGSDGNVITGTIQNAQISNNSVGIQINGQIYTPAQISKIYSN